MIHLLLEYVHIFSYMCFHKNVNGCIDPVLTGCLLYLKFTYYNVLQCTTYTHQDPPTLELLATEASAAQAYPFIKSLKPACAQPNKEPNRNQTEDIVRCSHGRRILRLCLKRKLIGSHWDWPKPSHFFRPVTSCTCTTGPPTQLERWETQSDLSKGRVIPNYRIRMYVLTHPDISYIPIIYGFLWIFKGTKHVCWSSFSLLNGL